jgi:hypothetical protein
MKLALRSAQQALPRLVALAAALGLSACAGQPPGPASGLRGVGTPGVSAYMPADQATSLQALLDRCQQAPQASPPQAGHQNLEGACDQLHRQLHNQPGNTVRAAAAK